MQKHRISTNIGVDNKVVVELKQDYDLLEILSLKFTQTEAYSSMCSDYGVVCGRISVNNGFGVPNIRVSIFIPIQDEDVDDPVISALYPYTTVDDKNENGYRYNLLPARRQHGGHAPTGTFPDQTDVLTREEVLEVYEKYYKYTVKTNEAGDFMIWGVPVGSQTLHVDADLSDIGCFSLRPDDFIRQGLGVDKFKNNYEFNSSNDIDSLPQIVSFNQTIEVYPFWGNEDLCEIGITRTDFDLTSRGVKIEPKAYLLGSVYSDQGKISVNKNCTPRGKMGRKCDLTTFGCNVEIMRFNNLVDSEGRPGLEFYEFQEDVDDDGSFVIPLPMNMDFIFTNEFGENEITNDPNKGIPTSACYRFRISPKDEGVANGNLGRSRTLASYLVPNLREYDSNDTEINKSYAWSLNWDDYPLAAINDSVIFKNVLGSYYPEDYFYRFTYNKVYTVSSFMGVHFSKGFLSGRDNFLGLKDISPKDDEDCQSEVLTPPTNWGWRKLTFPILLTLVINFFERLIYKAFMGAIQIIIFPFQLIYQEVRFTIDLGFTTFTFAPFDSWDELIIEPLQNFGTLNLGTVVYPECESCGDIDIANPNPVVGSVADIDPEVLYEKVGEGKAVRDTVNVLVDCETWELEPPTTSGSTIFTYRDCSTNASTTITLTSGSSVTTVCIRPLSLSITQVGNGDGSGTAIGQCDTLITYTPIYDPDSTKEEFILSDVYTGATVPLTSYSAFTVSGNTYTFPFIKSKQSAFRKFLIKLTGYLPHGDVVSSGSTAISNLNLTATGRSNLLNLTTYSVSIPITIDGYKGTVVNNLNNWIRYIDNDGNDFPWTGFTYEIYDTFLLKPLPPGEAFDSAGLPDGCLSRNTIYKESIVKGSYCGTGTTQSYDTLTPVAGTSCKPFNLLTLGQWSYSQDVNRCRTCPQKSGFSELRNGIYSVVPAADSSNWNIQFDLIDEYARTKLVNKLFCEGIVSYSFIDNWLAGSLYMFPFKAKVRWDNEEELDLNFRWTKYCSNLVYFKVSESTTNSPVKRFYYRSTKFNGSDFTKYDGFGDDYGTLAHPTTVVDLGPRDEFIKEICVDPSLDPNCSVVRSVGSTSFQNFKELLGLYINYRLDTGGENYTYKNFFDNTGYVFNNNKQQVLNGDALQLLSINNEAGIEEFDLQNKSYGAYSPSVLDPDDYINLFQTSPGVWGPLPVNFILDTDGFRVRTCLNEPGRLTESSQTVPFFYWDKKALGFGSGVSQSWDYATVISQKLQGMTYQYAFTGDSSYNYVLFPMTKQYSGETITIGGVQLNDVGFDIETTGSTVYLSYSGQEEGFTVLYITSGTTDNPLAGTLYTRTGSTGNWASRPWTSDVDFIIKPTGTNYNSGLQILSTPFLFYFGLRPGKTAVDKFIARFGPAGVFPSAE